MSIHCSTPSSRTSEIRIQFGHVSSLIGGKMLFRADAVDFSR